MNKIILTGNLTKDMEVEITSNDKIHGKLSIANNVGYGENQKTNFINCDLYGQRVDTLSKYLLKGAKVLINGQLNVNNVEKEPNRYQRLELTHPQLHEYCMNKLGFKEVCEYMNIPYTNKEE